MIIKIRIDLNDPDQRDRYERMMKADAMAGILWELLVNRKKKYEQVIDNMTTEGIDNQKQPDTIMRYILDDISDSLQDEGIDIEKLYK